MARIYGVVNGTTIQWTKERHGNIPYQVIIDGDILPITPSKITISQVDRTETVYLADDTFTVIPHRDGAQTFSFDFRIPMYQPNLKFVQGRNGTNELLYPFEISDSTPSHQFWSDKLWDLKKYKRRTELCIIRHYGDTSMVEPVFLTDWSYEEDAEKGNDFIFHVTFTDYQDQYNQEIGSTVEHHLIKSKNVRGWTDT